MPDRRSFRFPEIPTSNVRRNVESHSGSTGRAKGVEIEHRKTNRDSCSCTDDEQSDADDLVFSFSFLAFRLDGAIAEYFTSLSLRRQPCVGNRSMTSSQPSRVEFNYSTTASQFVSPPRFAVEHSNRQLRNFLNLVSAGDKLTANGNGRLDHRGVSCLQTDRTLTKFAVGCA